MFPGFNKAKRGSISNGDWDRDGVKNRKDCEPLNFRKQDGGSNGLNPRKGKWQKDLGEPGEDVINYGGEYIYEDDPRWGEVAMNILSRETKAMIKKAERRGY